MSTLEELNNEIRAAREEIKAAIEASASYWERQPPAGEGEEAWSPRQVAEHVVTTESVYTNRLLETAGRASIDKVEPSYPTPADAVKGLFDYGATLEQKTKDLTEADLARPHERMGNVAGFFGFRARHLRAHADQIREASKPD
jgi:uncharacterized damage-inducible protein DinB